MNAVAIVLLALGLQSHNPMGFDQQKTVHHFVLTASGGYIDVSVRDAADSSNRDAIQSHLSHIAQMFKDGNFNIPMLVHGEKPAGIETLRRLKHRIKYEYKATNSGGRVTITTSDKQALQGVHEFLRYQIQEHKTGDSLSPHKGP
jgi:hypothetical protein